MKTRRHTMRFVEQAVTHFRKYTNVMAICGVLVLLLTALAQVE